MEVKFCPNHPDKIARKRSGLCRSCYEKKLAENNPEYKKKQQENSRNWHERNRKYKADYDREYRKKLTTEDKRKAWLRKKYKLTMEEFRFILNLQGNKCYICETKLNEGDKFLHIDHDHKTNEVRGILCSQCNWFMSKIDNVEKCYENLTNYIKNKGTEWRRQKDTIKESSGTN